MLYIVYKDAHWPQVHTLFLYLLYVHTLIPEGSLWFAELLSLFLFCINFIVHMWEMLPKDMKKQETVTNLC